MLLEKQMYIDVLNAIVKDKIAYDEFNEEGPSKSLLDDKVFFEKNQELKLIIKALEKENIPTLFSEQSIFRHCIIQNNEKEVNEKSKIRIYMCPKDEYILDICKLILQKSCQKKQYIHLKYSTESNRKDKIVIYLLDVKNYFEKIEILKEIKQEHPEYFKEMDRRIDWISKTSIDGVFLAPNPTIKNMLGKTFPSYGALMDHVFSQSKNLLLYSLNVSNKDALSKYSIEELLEKFIPIFDEQLLNHLAYIKETDKNLKIYIKDSEIPTSPDDLINCNYDYDSNDRVLIYGIKQKDNMYKFYKIPLGYTGDLTALKSATMSGSEYVAKKINGQSINFK